MTQKSRHYKKRRKTGSLSALYKLLCFVVVCTAIAVAMVLFFKTQEILVTGNTVYSREEIIDASGVKTGDNLYLMNKFDAAERITRRLPYVEEVQISRRLPDTLVIAVSECSAPAGILQDGQLWLLSGSGKIVDQKPAAQSEKYALISGVTLVEPQVGYPARAAEESAGAMAAMTALLPLLQERDMLGDTQALQLEGHDAITLRYLDRFEVLLPREGDWAYKLDYLLAVVQRLEDNETGTIDMLSEGTASFIPRSKTAAKPKPETGGTADPAAGTADPAAGTATDPAAGTASPTEALPLPRFE